MARVLMVGLNRLMVQALKDSEEAGHHVPDLYVVEEEDVWTKKGLDDVRLPDFVKEKRFVEYQQRPSAAEEVAAFAGNIGADAVFAGAEYAVLPAALAADALGLRGLGERAASALTNKLNMRGLCEEEGLPVPRFRRVYGEKDIKDFLRGPAVVKPANREASAGVVRLAGPEDAGWAWRMATSADEGIHVADREMPWEYMVEDLMSGEEVSTEALVRDGRMEFFNVTWKSTASGAFPVEAGHYLPAELGGDWDADLVESMERLIRALRVGCGVLHAEWMLSADGPRLIECAGRPPGDFIFEMIEEAYELRPYSALLDVLLGTGTDWPAGPSGGAAVAFVNPAPGRVIGASVPDDVREAPEVVRTNVMVKTGQTVADAKSSWDRGGYVMVSGHSGPEAWRTARELVGRLDIRTVPFEERVTKAS